MKPDGSQVFHVSTDQAGRTLASALKGWLPGSSWNQARQLITGRRVQINGNLCLDEGRRLRDSEVVKVFPHALAAPPREDDVRIVYVDAHVVVVEKPAGMTTLRHSEEREWNSRRKQIQPTLDEVLPRVLGLYLQHRQRRRVDKSRNQRGAGAQHERRVEPPRFVPVRAVHRLDRDTSGLMVFARTVPAERGLVQQFRKHSIHRAYQAVIHGEIEAQTFESYLVRDRGDGRRGSTKLANTGQRAVTHVQPLERLGKYTLIECRLETGRTHQIRIHLSEAGHFLCGDKVYCQPLFKKPQADRSGAPRLALHAAELGFTHPVTGEELSFVQPLPHDLSDFVDRLRGRPRQPHETRPTQAQRVPSTRSTPPRDDADLGDSDFGDAELGGDEADGDWVDSGGAEDWTGYQGPPTPQPPGRRELDRRGGGRPHPRGKPRQGEGGRRSGQAQGGGEFPRGQQKKSGGKFPGGHDARGRRRRRRRPDGGK